MPDTISGEIRGASVALFARESLAHALIGGEHVSRAARIRNGPRMLALRVYEDIPKGLIRNRQLWLPPGSIQTLKIYGELTEREIDVTLAFLTNRLSRERDASFAPVRIEFLLQEVFEVTGDGATVRGVEEVLRSTIHTEV
jgi:hypothetical protein